MPSSEPIQPTDDEWLWPHIPNTRSMLPAFTVTGIELIPYRITNPTDSGSQQAPAQYTKKVSFNREQTSVFYIGRIPSSEANARRVPEGEGEVDTVEDGAYYNCGVMSRKHAKFTFSDRGSAYLIDTDSHHGVYVGRHGREPFKLEPKLPYLLFNNDLVTFGRAVTKSGKVHEPVTVKVVLIKSSANPPAPSNSSPPMSTSSGRYGLNPTDIDIDDDDDEDDDDVESEDKEESSSSPSSDEGVPYFFPQEPIVVHDSPSPTPDLPPLPAPPADTPQYILIEDSPAPDQPTRDSSSSFSQQDSRPPFSFGQPSQRGLMDFEPFASLLGNFSSNPSNSLPTPPSQMAGDMAGQDLKVIKEGLERIEAEVSRLQKARRRTKAKIIKSGKLADDRMDSLEERLETVARNEQLLTNRLGLTSVDDFKALQKQIAGLETAIQPLIEREEAWQQDESDARRDMGILAANMDEVHEDIVEVRDQANEVVGDLQDIQERAEDELRQLMDSFKAARSRALKVIEQASEQASNSLKRKHDDSDLEEQPNTGSAPSVTQDAVPRTYPLAKRIRRDVVVAGAFGLAVWAGLSSF